MAKDFIDTFINLFTRIVTSVLVFSGLYILFFWGPNTTIEVSYIFAVLGLSLFLALTRTPIVMAENITSMQALILHIAYFILVNTTVAVIGFLLKWFSMDNKRMLVCFELLIIVVYAVVTLLCYFIDCNTTNKMNERLKKFSDGE